MRSLRLWLNVIAFTLLAAAFFCLITPPLNGATQVTTSDTVPHWRVRLAALTKAGAIEVLPTAILESWTPQGTLTLETSGKTRKLSTVDVLSIHRINSAAQPASATLTPWWLRTRTGDALPGVPLASKNGILSFKSIVFGTLNIPLTDVAAISRMRRLSSKGATAHDHLTFINGDKLTGTMLKFTSHGVKWNSTLGTITIPMARINSIKLAQTLPPVPPGGPLIRVTCTDGTVITAKHINCTTHQITLTPTALPAVRCGVHDVEQIDILGGHIAWLTAMKPEHYFQTSYLGAPWPLMVNKNCMGKALRAGGRIFHHGLGVHVTASLIYAVNDRYTTLVFIPAMDQSASPWGMATVRVLGDGKQIFKSRALQPGAVLQPVRVSLAGVKTLEIQVDGTNHFGVRGRVDLLHAALLK
jgi:hypothetical protein